MEYQIHIIEPNNKDFLKYCLDNDLYKTSADPNFNSRMKSIYEEDREFTTLTVVLALENKAPVGILICEDKEEFSHGLILDSVRRNRVTKRYDWGFYFLGTLGMYVKPEFRNKGIAKDMLSLIEDYKMNTLKDIPQINELSVAIFQAREDAYEIVNKCSRYAYVTHLNYSSYNYVTELSMLSRALIEHRECEPFPMYNVPEKLVYNYGKNKIKP